MRKKLIIVFMMLALTVALGAKTKVIPMPDLMKVDLVLLDDTRMYLVDGTTIYIYSQKDFKLIKKFGKAGHGPQEFGTSPFSTGLFLDVTGEDLMVHSMGKISWFTKDGVYKKEQKLPNPLTMFIRRFGKELVGRQMEGVGGGERFQVLKKFDMKVNVLKEIIRTKDDFQMGKGTRIMKTQRVTAVHGDKLFTAWESEFNIKVFGPDLKELFTIKRDEKKRKVTAEDKKNVIEFLKTFRLTRNFFEMMKPITFPEFFPAVQNIIPTGDTLYVITFHQNKTKHDECLIMDLKGKLLKRTFLPLEMSTPILPYAYTIHKGFLYQLVEDEEEEEWSLHITEIK